ncbi:MAG TPA: hypothetical protein VJB90_00730 [Candidatus Nanoarchaeia archaeon]|nr:hypothetical protein [Candidatus Nanoarchaeia archaeon]
MPVNKKGIAISMETIVIAVIVVAVMVILLFVFVSGIGKEKTKIESCSVRNGICSNAPCSDTGAAELQKAPAGKGDLQGCQPSEIYCCSTIKNQ